MSLRTPPRAGTGAGAEWLLLACGVVAALHVGKLPPALPTLRDAFDISLVQAGFLLSTVQLGSMLLGVSMGLSVRRIGLRRSLAGGLWLIAFASLMGTQAGGAFALLVGRALEGLGVLLVALSAPSLLRHTVPPQRQALRLGLWGTYMPTGTGLALLCGPFALRALGWAGWWAALGLLSAATALAVARVLPPDVSNERARDDSLRSTKLLTSTLRQPGPWLLALCFAAYAAQWLTVIGFLPTIYAESGIAAGTAGVLTALAALANAVGNIAGGRLLHRGMPPLRLLLLGFAAMALGAGLAFAWMEAIGFPIRFAAVLVFSGVGGLVPSTLFALGGRTCTDARAMPIVVGLMTHGTGAGQFLGPPAAAWWAQGHGGWSQTWVVTSSTAVAGVLLTLALYLVLSPARGR